MKKRNIDNTAKIFSLDFKKNANVFRFCVVLKEKVNKKILVEALNKSLESHEAFRVRVKMGWLWDYFVYNDKDIIIEESNRELDHFDYSKNNNYLFRVTYNKRIINVDFYHMLTDGAGAIEFIKSIVSNYLDIKNGTDYNKDEKRYCLSYSDEFLNKYDKSSKSNPGLKNIYLFPDKRMDNVNYCYCYTVFVDEIKAVSKSYNATITEYLTALYIYAIYNSMYDKKSKKEIALTIPIDIRKHYKVDTLSNFFVCMKVNPNVYEKKLYSFLDILDSVKDEFKNNLSDVKIKEYLAKEVRLGKHIAYKYFPSFIKKFFMGHLGKHFGTSTTSTLSNLGIINFDDRYVSDIDNVYALVMPGRLQKIKCTIGTFSNKLNIMMNSNIEDIIFEKEFYRLLKNDFKRVNIVSNRDVKLVKDIK